MNVCENCDKEYDLSVVKNPRFCNIRCSRSFSTKFKREEINKKVSESLKGKYLTSKLMILICKYCSKEFNLPYYKSKNRQFCSKNCFYDYLRYTEEGNSKTRQMGLKSSQILVKRSKNEIYFYELCSEIFKSVDNNKPIFNGWDADIIIHDLKIAVLWNGKWHYEKITNKYSLKQIQNRDKIKLKEIDSFGYQSYIIKDLGKFNKNFVEKEFIKFKDFCGIE